MSSLDGFGAERSRLTYVTVAVVSLSGLLFEFIQTRILSYIFWNHIVYLTISLALLGFGISGTLVSWLTRSGQRDLRRLISDLAGAMSFSLALSVLLIGRALPLLRYSASSLKLMACYLVSVLPFIFAGSILSLVFSYSKESTGRLYRTDLLAASAGCVAFFCFLPVLGAVPGIALLSVSLAALSYLWAPKNDVRAHAGTATVAAIAVALLLVSIIRPRSVDYAPETYKETGTMLADGAHIEKTRWTNLSRIDVVAGSSTQLLNYREHPEGSYKILTQDGSAHTRLVGKKAVDDISAKVRAGKPVHPAVIPYSIMNHPDVAIIGTGGGIDVADALSHDANSVYGTWNLTRNTYADWNGGLMKGPRVQSINAEGRSAIRSTNRKFDMIQVIAIDTFAALNSGAYVLSENYLYTVDAFRDYFSHLKPGGMLSLYRWNSNPPKETLRLSVLAAEAWRQEGVNHIGDRIMALGSPEWAISIFKNRPFTPEEVETMYREGQKTGETVFYWPKVRDAIRQAEFERSYYGGLNDAERISIASAFNRCITAYDNGTEKDFFRSYPFKVTPTTDDSPFFFESSSLFSTRNWNLDKLRGGGVQSTLVQIGLMSTVVMLLAILLPLAIFQREGLRVDGAGQYAVYFAGLGFGFMLIEISLMQKCVLVLGNPMYSVPVLLAAILLSAGLGSGAAGSWSAPFRRKISLACVLLLAAVIVAAAFLTYAAPLLLRLGFAGRAISTALITVPVGFALGIFFPAGLDRLRDQAPAFVPWAWGINGCASVYGSVVAIIAAMWHGFNFVLLLGIITYMASTFVAILLARRSRPMAVLAEREMAMARAAVSQVGV